MRTKLQLHFLLTALLVAIGCANAGQKTSAPDAAWTAEWIGSAESSPNLWTCYRKIFVVGKVPARALTRIAVDSKYWLWVNGKLVVREGALKRGPTPTGTYFDEIDLAPHLRQGSNTVAALVWYFGKQG